MKLISFPEINKNNCTWEEGMEAILENTDAEIKQVKIKNMIIIGSMDDDNYTYGILSQERIVEILGAIECAKNHLILELYHGV